MDAGLVTPVVALDIAEAFDCVLHRGLIVKLKVFGTEENLLEIFSNYLIGRAVTVIVNSQTHYCNIKTSVSQGSVLRWNNVINYLIQGFPSSYAHADDCTLSHTYKRKNVLTYWRSSINNTESLGRRW